jgi:hypothetical protein
MNKDSNQLIYLKYLIQISKLLYKYKPVIFYGTLLGITRENHIIKNDDDIDFLVDFKFKNKIINHLLKNKKFKINKKKSDTFFSQFYFKINNIFFYIDFYFYINKEKNSYIIDKHNFFGDILSKKSFLHIPKSLFFPIKKNNKIKNIYLPNKSKALCKFLYGNHWNVPLKKNAAYKIKIINNKPMIIKMNYLSYLAKEIKLHLKSFFKIFSNNYTI